MDLFPVQPAETIQTPDRLFGSAPSTWVEQQLDDGGETRREESDVRANAAQASSGAGEGVEGQKTAAWTSFCVNAAFLPAGFVDD